MAATWLSQTKKGFRLAVQVSPYARKSEIVFGDGDVLRIRLQARPVDGDANEELIAFLSRKLRIPKRQIAIAHGVSARKKLLEIVDADFSLEELENKISKIRERRRL